MSVDARPTEPWGTLVVPVYNAESFLARSLQQIHAWMIGRPEPWEMILVDDASSDASGSILESFAAAHSADRIRVVRFHANHGKGFAVRVGLDQSAGRVAIFTDCDLAYPLENIDRLLARLKDGADAAIACRVLPDSTYMMSPSFFSYLFTRHLMGRGFNVLCRMIAVPGIRDTQAGLKGFRTATVKPLLSRLRFDGFSFDVELLRGLIDRGARIAEVPVVFRYDSEPSTVSFVADALRMARDLLLVRWRSLRRHYTREPLSQRVIIHADDYGLAPGVNRAIEEGLVSGALHSASILTGSPFTEPALAWAAARPTFDFGVHLNVTQGRPVLARERVRSLVDREGRFHRLRPFLARFATGRIALSEIEAEWRAQIRLVRDAGVRVSHLDSHQHVHLVPAIFRRVAARLAGEEGLSLRAMDGPLRFGGFTNNVKGVALAVATRLSVGRRFRHLVTAHGAALSLGDGATLETLRSSLRGARPGETVELVVHPGFADEGLRTSGDRYLEGRDVERAFLASDETRSWIRLSGYRPSDFRGRALSSRP